MNFRKLITYLTMGTAAAMPLAVAQNPTILQGSYISNVFGNSNFIKNPNAQTNIADVTVSNATVTRSTATPLVATSEFLVTTSTATGSATWSTRTFDGGMKGQNCEARFSYRGFSVGSTTAQILQGANVVAQLTLTPSTDPRIASINFPCGDLSSATTFRLQQATASLTGTNEIGGIYVGLATNMANVAQATKVGGFDNMICGGEPQLTAGAAFTYLSPNVAGTCSGTAVGLASAASSNLNTLTFQFNNLPPGEYVLLMPAYVYPISVVSGSARCDGRIRETTLNLFDGGNAFSRANTTEFLSIGSINQFKFQNPTTGNRVFQVEYNRHGTTWGCGGGFLNYQQNVSLYRFPSSSELVVTPERQNVFAAARFTSVNAFVHSGGTAPTGYATLSDPAFAANVTRFGKAAAPLASGCFAGVSCSANDFGFSVPNLPVGSYSVRVNGLINALVGSNTTECSFQILEAVTGTSVGKQSHVDNLVGGNSNRDFNAYYAGIFNNTSVATRNFIVRAEKISGSTTGICQVNAASFRDVYMELIPLDQPSNSALYVQGPVKAAETGAAIPAGYVGEILEASDVVNASSGTYNLLSLALTPGVWDVQGKCSNRRNGATITNANWIASIVNQDANPDEQALTQFSGGSFVNIDDMRLLTIPTRVTWNGTTNVTKWSISNTSSNLVYLRCYPSTFTGGPVIMTRHIRATRLN